MNWVSVYWECEECGEEWTTREEAIACCAASEEPVTAHYHCNECGNDFLDYEAAVRCCHGDSVIVTLATPEELEAAGQTRLFE